MNYKKSLAALAVAAFSLGAQAQTEIQWWHSMGGALGEWVNDLAKDFNASQKDYKIVPTFKGNYDESMAAAIAAYRAGNAPHFASVRSGHGHHDGQQRRHRARGQSHARRRT
jgi:sn-glycerol 3-phosphate transport system substrate-binding protein